jgi:hypothetical protein
VYDYGRRMILMRQIFTVVIFLSISNISYSDDIIAGRRYNLDEIGKLPIHIFAEIPLSNNVVTIYKQNNNGQWFNKLILFKDNNGKYIDAYGVNFNDGDIYRPSYVNKDVCIIAVTTDPTNFLPFMRFLFVNPESKEIVFLPRNHRDVGDICLLGDYIYYSVGMDRTTIWRVKILTGQLGTYDGYYPGVDLFEITEDDKVFIYFNSKGINYILDPSSGEIRKTDKVYKTIKKKRVADYIKREQISMPIKTWSYTM